MLKLDTGECWRLPNALPSSQIVRYQVEPFEQAIETVQNVEIVQNFDHVGRDNQIEYIEYRDRGEYFDSSEQVEFRPGGSELNANVQHIQNDFDAERDDDSLPDVTLYFQHIENVVDTERDDDSLPDVTLHTLDSISSTAVEVSFNYV